MKYFIFILILPISLLADIYLVMKDESDYEEKFKAWHRFYPVKQLIKAEYGEWIIVFDDTQKKM